MVLGKKFGGKMEMLTGGWKKISVNFREWDFWFM
jgi:hypothetical protein